MVWLINISKKDTLDEKYNYIDFKDIDIFITWLYSNFKDLDAVDLETEHQELLRDTTLGFSEEERKQTLKRAKQIATAFNIGSTVLGILLFFVKGRCSYIVLLVLPLLGILLLYCFELIKLLSNSKKSVYPWIYIGIGAPALALLLKSMEFNVLHLEKIFVPAGIVGGIFFLLLCVKGINKSMGVVIGQVLAVLVVSCIYGFGSIRAINCSFDASTQQRYVATVIGKKITEGKRTSYDLRINPWGPQHKVENEDVSRKEYSHTQIGDIVIATYKKGYLDAPWYVIATQYDIANDTDRIAKKPSSLPMFIVDDRIVSKAEMIKYDPNTIEQVTILKNTKIMEKYGEEAKNGVILVTTKSYLKLKRSRSHS